MVLTRAQTEAEKFSEVSDQDNSGAVWIASIGNTQISQEQREDSIIGPILKWKSEGRRPNWSEVVSMSAACKTYWSMWHQLAVKQGVLYKRWDEEISGKANWQLVVPQCRRQEILEMVHDHSTGGHLGEHKTLANVRARFYWYGHRRDVHKWCSSCEVCASRKGPNKKNRGKMGHVKAGFPMERVALDIMGPLPRSDRGNRYLLVLSDYFTKWVEAYSIPNQEAMTIARKVVEEFICRFGVPLAIHTDQGRQFESTLFREMCHLLDIDKTRTTAFHPQSDGLVERMNRTGSGLNCPGTSGSVIGSGLTGPGTSSSGTGSGLTGPGTSGLRPGCGFEYPGTPNKQDDDPVTMANVVSSPDIVNTEDAVVLLVKISQATHFRQTLHLHQGPADQRDHTDLQIACSIIKTLDRRQPV